MCEHRAVAARCVGDLDDDRGQQVEVVAPHVVHGAHRAIGVPVADAGGGGVEVPEFAQQFERLDRKSTRLNSSH